MGALAGMDLGSGRARLFMQEVNCSLIQRAARRRQAVGRGEGARPPIAAARGAVDLVELTRRLPDGKVEQVTPLGWKTTIRRLPPVLSALDINDPRRVAATGFAVIVERIGAIKNVDIGGGGGGGNNSGAPSDGGAAAKVRHAEALWQIRGVLNGWRLSQPARRYIRGEDLVVMAPCNRAGDRLAIKAYRLIELVCVEGLDMKQILELHGWSAHAIHRRKLREVILDLLDLIAIETGWRADG